MKLKNFPIILLIILFISACKKQDEADTQLPTVTFTGLALNDTLRNTVTAEIKGDDNSGKIGKMQVFANDSLIATATGENLSLNWNTLTVKDGTYTMKIVAIDHAGNKKEETTKVFVNNALIQLDADVVNSPFYETVDYIITDLEGNILNTLRSEKGTATGTVSINPKTAFEGDAIHLIRIEQNSFKQIQYFLSIKRGVHIKNNIQTGKDRFPTRNGPFSIKVNNLPEYDSFTVSSDRTSFTLPGDSYWSESMYSSPESKILVQVEKDGKGKYHIFDLLQGVKQITVDAALCTTNSLTKTIKLPFVVENAYIHSYGIVEPGFSEHYTFADQTFNGDQVSIHYPGNLVKETHTTVRFSKEGLNFSHYFYKNIPEEVIYRDISATINNRSLSDFQVKFTGKFEYYRTAFTNMSNFESTDPNFIELLIYGAPGNTAFKFPDISQEGIISGFKPKDFKLVAMTLYDFDKPADKLNELNSNNGYTPADALEKIIVGVPVN